MITYRILTKDLETGDEKLLMKPPELPQISFEQAARGNWADVSFKTSPLGRWVICTPSMPQATRTKWFINLTHGTHCKFPDRDDDKAWLSKMIFYANESRLCAIFHSRRHSRHTHDGPEIVLDLYDINEAECKKIGSFELNKYASNFHFLGNDRILYLRESAGLLGLPNGNELWVLSITDGTEQKFCSN